MHVENNPRGGHGRTRKSQKAASAQRGQSGHYQRKAEREGDRGMARGKGLVVVTEN